MPIPTRSELQNRIKELETENDELQSRLDEISDIVAPARDDSDDDGGEDYEDDSEE